MNKLSYHLILVNSSLRVLTDQVEQLCKCLQQHPPSVLGCDMQEPSFAEASAGKPSLTEVLADKPKPDPPSVLRRDMQSILNSVYEKIKRTRKGIAFTQIKKKTGFNRKQIANAIYKLKKRNMIVAKTRGVYIKR